MGSPDSQVARWSFSKGVCLNCVSSARMGSTSARLEEWGMDLVSLEKREASFDSPAIRFLCETLESPLSYSSPLVGSISGASWWTGGQCGVWETSHGWGGTSRPCPIVRYSSSSVMEESVEVPAGESGPTESHPNRLLIRVSADRSTADTLGLYRAPHAYFVELPGGSVEFVEHPFFRKRTPRHQHGSDDDLPVGRGRVFRPSVLATRRTGYDHTPDLASPDAHEGGTGGCVDRGPSAM